MTKQDKVAKVMHEWKAGTLTSHGKQVTDYDQAVAIALSEAGLSKNMEKGGKMNKYEKGGNMNKYAKGGAVDAPKIYVADLEAYNNGKLVGEWLDLSDFEDGKEVSKEISKLLKKWGAEEYAIHDVENVPSSIYSEYMGEEDFDKIIKIYKASEENDLPYEVISEIILQYEPKDLEEWISDHYEGHFDNDTDLAYSVVESMGGVAELGDKTIDMYFDYEKFGRDLAINDYTEIEDGYYFRTPRYAKGGLTNERRYVNKSQDYEVRYAKNRPMRKGYNDERMFEGGGSIENQYKGKTPKKVWSEWSIEQKSHFLKDHFLTNTDYSEDKKEQVREAKYLNWDDLPRAVQMEVERHIFMGQYAVGGEIGNTVSFKGDYGTPRSGVIKEKRGSSYIVGTDDGDRLVDSYEVISFSETPIAKKKRFGFFAGGGEIENKIEKLKKVVSSKMLPESVKAKAQAEIDKLEKELHESKETKAEEKEEHKAGGSEFSKDELNRLIRSFEEINDFYEENKKEPIEESDMGERMLSYRLKGLREQDNKIKILLPYDKFNLLKKSKEGKAEDYIEAKTKALEKSLKDKTISETQRKRDEKELALFKGAKKPKFKIGDVVGLDLDEATPKKITSFKTNRKGEIIYSGYYIPFPNEKWNYEESEIVLLKTPSKPEAKKPTTKKPTTRKAPVRKAPVKKAVVKKVEVKSKVVGDDLKVIKFFDLTESDWNKMALNERNKLSESYKEKNKAPKADHKKLVAKLKAKKGDKEYDNRASINVKTGERYKRSESSDKKREALPLGKRISADGSVYYENRLNRGDLSKKDKFKTGGEIKKADRIEKMVENWKKYGFAISSVSKTNDDADFFKALKINQDEVGITSQTGNDVVYYNTKVKNKFNRDDFEKGGELKSSGWGLNLNW